MTISEENVKFPFVAVTTRYIDCHDEAYMLHNSTVLFLTATNGIILESSYYTKYVDFIFNYDRTIFTELNKENSDWELLPYYNIDMKHFIMKEELKRLKRAQEIIEQHFGAIADDL